MQVNIANCKLYLSYDVQFFLWAVAIFITYYHRGINIHNLSQKNYY